MNPIRIFAMLISIGWVSGCLAGTLLNGSFESGFAGWNAQANSSPSVSSAPPSPIHGNFYALLTTAGTADTSAFARLCGDGVVRSGTGGSVITQSFSMSAGDTLVGSFDYLTNEASGSQYDFGLVYISWSTGNADLFFRNSSGLSSAFGTGFSLHSGWTNTNFTAPVTDTFTLSIIVTDTVDAIFDSAITADALNIVPAITNNGGPYTISEGSPLILAASATDPDGPNALSYSWDVNGDNIFTDATGATPTLTWSQLNALGISSGPNTLSNLRVRVSDGISTVNSGATSLTVNNVDPTVTAITFNPAPIYYGDTISLSGTFTDPAGSGDNSYQFVWTITNSAGPIATPGAQPISFGASLTLSFVANKADTYSVTLTVTDKDGGAGSNSTSIVVTPKPITVTMNPIPPTLFGANVATLVNSWNELSVTVGGLVLGDDINDLDGDNIAFNPTPTFSTPVELTPIGTYSVLPGGLSNPNYAITYVPADLTISRNQRPRRSVTPVVISQQ